MKRGCGVTASRFNNPDHQNQTILVSDLRLTCIPQSDTSLWDFPRHRPPLDEINPRDGLSSRKTAKASAIRRAACRLVRKDGTYQFPVEAGRRTATKDAVVVLRSFGEPPPDLVTNHAERDRAMLWGVVDVRSAQLF